MANLTEALIDPDTKAEVTTNIRSLHKRIRLVPDDIGGLDIKLVGELVRLLSLGLLGTQKANRRWLVVL